MAIKATHFAPPKKSMNECKHFFLAGYQSDVLQFATLPLVSRATCRWRFRANRVRTRIQHLCAGGTGFSPKKTTSFFDIKRQTIFLGSDACQGDSGSALFRIRPRADTVEEKVKKIHAFPINFLLKNIFFQDGSVVRRYELVGITSFGAKCGDVGMPGILFMFIIYFGTKGR